MSQSQNKKYNYDYDPIDAENKALFGDNSRGAPGSIKKISGLSSISKVRKNITKSDAFG